MHDWYKTLHVPFGSISDPTGHNLRLWGTMRSQWTDNVRTDRRCGRVLFDSLALTINAFSHA